MTYLYYDRSLSYYFPMNVVSRNRSAVSLQITLVEDSHLSEREIEFLLSACVGLSFLGIISIASLCQFINNCTYLCCADVILSTKYFSLFSRFGETCFNQTQSHTTIISNQPNYQDSNYTEIYPPNLISIISVTFPVLKRG